MAFIDVVYETERRKSIGGISIDAFVNESHSCSSSVTDNPVEDAENVADHVSHDPDTLEIEGVVGAAGVLETSGGNFRWIDAYVALRELRDNKTLVSVITGLRVYSNMIIESFTVPRAAEDGGALVFSMSLKEVRVVRSQAAVIPKSILGGSASDQRQAQGQVKAGSVPTAAVSDTESGSFLDPIRAQVQAAFGG